MVNIEDLRKGFIEMKIFITKNELGYLYHFIDTGNAGLISFFEFVEFWQYNINIFDKFYYYYL